MRKNRSKHEAKKPRLAKRALALCFALIFVCSCLLPAFAYGDVATFEADGGAALLDDGYGVDTQDVDAQDNTPSADVPATQPGGISTGGGINMGGSVVIGGDSTTDNDQKATVTTDKDGNIVYTWDVDKIDLPEDATITRPDEDHALDKVDAAFSLPTNIYHFWLKEMSSYDLEEVSTDAKAADMTVEQYLAMYGKDKGCYHIMTAADGADLNAYKFADPTYLDDTEGRDFAGWYTIDEFGEKHDFTFDQTLFISTGTTVEVFPKWVKADADSDEDEDKADSAESDSTISTAAAEYAELKTDATLTDDSESSVNVSVDVSGVFKGAKSVKVAAMSDAAMQSFYESYVGTLEDENQAATFILGMSISPKDEQGAKIQPEGKAEVKVTGLSGIGIEAGSPLCVFHQTAEGRIETLNAKYSEGVLTFETDSFSYFVVALDEPMAVDTLDLNFQDFNGTYKNKLTVNESIVLKCGNWHPETENGHYGSQYKYTYEWASSNTSVIRIVNDATITDANLVRVEAVSTGSATIRHIRHRWYKGRGDHEWQQLADLIENSYTITVETSRSEQTADIFFLKTPNTGVEKNEAEYWLPREWKNGKWQSVLTWQVDSTDMDGTVNTTGATWDDRNKNIMLNASGNAGGTYVTGWPDGSKESTWTLYRNCTVDDGRDKKLNQDVFGEVLKSIWNAYQAELASDLGVSADTLKDDQITQITLIPYKISSNSTMHIDCTISATGIAYTAKFWVEEPGETGYKQVYAKNYKNDETVKEPTSQEMVTWTNNNNGQVSLIKNQKELPETYTVNGVTYRFDGWYPEGNPNDTIPDLNKETVPFEYTPSNTEKENGVVNFYARYVPDTTDITITKIVTGAFAEKDKAFDFKITGRALEGLTANVTVSYSDGSSATRDHFTLKNGETATVSGIPVGVTFVVVEQCTDTEYDTTASGHGNTKAEVTGDKGDRSFAYQLVEVDGQIVLKAVKKDGSELGTSDDVVANKAITVTNEKDGTPDNGVLLDTLPYLIILGIAVAGGAALLLHKRKHDDE